jgi:uncharacterized protein (TIGR03083 family)
MSTDQHRNAARSPAGPQQSPQPLGYSRWMAAAEEEYERLLRLLGGLDAEHWNAPTDCDGWAVRDVVAHLAGAAASTATLRELVRQARSARRLGSQGDLVDRMNQVQVDERRSMPPEGLLGDLEVNAKRGLGARRRIPGPVQAVPVPFGPPLGTRPLGYLMGRIYTRDAWMHRVDLARATGAALELTGGHDGAIVEDVVAEWAAAHTCDYDVRLDGPAGGRWTRGSTSDATVRMDAVDFARTLSGRVPGDGLLAHRVPF